MRVSPPYYINCIRLTPGYFIKMHGSVLSASILCGLRGKKTVIVVQHKLPFRDKHKIPILEHNTTIGRHVIWRIQTQTFI